jgi:hypothetical protein
MTTLNRQRANIVFSTLLSSDPGFSYLVSNQEQHTQQKHESIEAEGETQPRTILTPAQVARQERIFDANGALRWYSSPSPPFSFSSRGPETLGSCQIGVSLRQFLSDFSSSFSTVSGSLKTALPLRAITSLFSTEDYILFLSGDLSPPAGPNIKASILLKHTSNSKSQLKAWTHALLAVRVLSLQSRHRDSLEDADEGAYFDTERILSVLSRTLVYLSQSGRFEEWISSLKGLGWDIDDNNDGEDEKGSSGSAIETRVGSRVVVSAS